MNGLEQDRRFLERLCDWAGLTPSKLGEEAGLASTTISRPMSGAATTRISTTTLDKLRARFPDFPGWDERLQSSASRDRRLPFHGASADEGRLLPRRATKPASAAADMVEVAGIDLDFGLGAAFMDQDVIEHQAERMPFPRAWLRQVTNSDPAQLYWTRGVGNSMEPTISDGDVILIDRSKVGTTFGDLCWAIAYGQTGMIKRLRPMPDGSVKIMSDNPAVPAEVAYDGELHVFGRVVAVVKRI